MAKPTPPALREVPEHIPRPSYAQPGARGVPQKPKTLNGRPKIITNDLKGEALERMRRACKAAREVLEEVLSAVRVGVTTEVLDIIAHEACVARGGYPSPLGYHGFPKSLCTSINEVICHGIPSDNKVLKDGDIINIDITVIKDEYHGDYTTSDRVIVEDDDKILVDLDEKLLDEKEEMKQDGDI